MPNEALISSQTKVVWFYGFANYQAGVWGDFCIPLANFPGQFICKH
jgi:hypothetical protein